MQRVMAWRSKNLGSRLGHAILLAALTWLATKSDLAPVWLVAITALSVLESSLFHSAGRTGSGRTRTLALVALAASTVCFAAIALVLMAHPSSVALPGAGLILCAINLNNTGMMRGYGGWPAASRRRPPRYCCSGCLWRPGSWATRSGSLRHASWKSARSPTLPSSPSLSRRSIARARPSSGPSPTWKASATSPAPRWARPSGRARAGACCSTRVRCRRSVSTPRGCTR